MARLFCFIYNKESHTYKKGLLKGTKEEHKHKRSIFSKWGKPSRSCDRHSEGRRRVVTFDLTLNTVTSIACSLTYCVSVVVSSDGLSDVPQLDGSTRRFHRSRRALRSKTIGGGLGLTIYDPQDIYIYCLNRHTHLFAFPLSGSAIETAVTLWEGPRVGGAWGWRGSGFGRVWILLYLERLKTSYFPTKT